MILFNLSIISHDFIFCFPNGLVPTELYFLLINPNPRSFSKLAYVGLPLNMFFTFRVQVVGQFVEPTPFIGAAIVEQNAITIGQALEATAHTAGDKPVDESDAAAIQAAEVRATGSNVVIPGGLAASAQSAAAFNAGVSKDEDKIKLKDILIVCLNQQKQRKQYLKLNSGTKGSQII